MDRTWTATPWRRDARVPGRWGLGKLPRHRFLITTDGYASVVRDPARSVLGVLWDLALSDVPALDRYESLHTGLYTKITQPIIAPGGAKRALVYVGRSARRGQPKPGSSSQRAGGGPQLGPPGRLPLRDRTRRARPAAAGTPLFKAPI